MLATCTRITLTTPTGSSSTISQAIGWTNVKDFGAKGSGKSTDDDTMVVQQCINLAQMTRGVVYFPPGAYFISAPLVVTSPCTLLGINNQSGFTVTGGQVVPGGFSALAPIPGIEALCITNTNDVIVENLNVIVVPPTTAGSGIHVQASLRVSIRNLALLGVWNGIDVDGSGDVTVEGVRIVPANVATSGRFGVRAQSGAGPTTLITCVVDQTQNLFGDPSLNLHTVDAFVIQLGYQTMTLNSCAAIAALHGFLSQNAGGAAPNFFQILGCRTYNCQVGIGLLDGQVAFVDATELIFDSTSTGPSATAYGLQVSSAYSEGPVVLTNVIVNGNSFNGAVGMDIEGGTLVVVNGGSVLNIGGDGIAVSSVANSAFAVNGLAATGITMSAVHVLAAHAGNLTLTGLAVTASNIGVTVDAAATGAVLVDGCAFANLTGQSINNPGGAIGPNLVPAKRRFVNNVGYNPAGVVFNPPVTSLTVINNSGVDQFVYLHGGAISIVKVNGVTLAGPSDTVLVPASGSLQIVATGTAHWTWFGN